MATGIQFAKQHMSQLVRSPILLLENMLSKTSVSILSVIGINMLLWDRFVGMLKFESTQKVCDFVLGGCT